MTKRKVGELEYVRGESHPQWSGENASYKARHYRVTAGRGQASQFVCTDCGKTATDWSQIHNSDGLDVFAGYEPRCRSCHMRYDDQGQRIQGYNHKGEAHGMHKLTEVEVHEIRKLLVEGTYTQKEIAYMYSVTGGAIRDVKTGRNWGWLK